MNTPQQQNQTDNAPQEDMTASPQQPMQEQLQQTPREGPQPQNRPMPSHQPYPCQHPSRQPVPIPQGGTASHSRPPAQGQPQQRHQGVPQPQNRPMPPQQGAQPSRPSCPGQQSAHSPQGSMPAHSRPSVQEQSRQIPRQQNVPAHYPQQPVQAPHPSGNGMDDYIGMNQAPKAAAPGFMEKEFMPTLLDAYSIAVKNALSIVIAILLWILTIWIPYINIGTTIALCTMPLALSRNRPISPTFIFDKRYRQFFGEFFLTGGLMLAGILAGALFCGFPAIVILISWSLAPMLVLDKGCNASEALTLSNKYTYGNKFLIFILFLALLISLGIILGILAAILGAIAEALSFIAVLLAVILVPATGVGLIAAIYKRLVYQASTSS